MAVHGHARPIPAGRSDLGADVASLVRCIALLAFVAALALAHGWLVGPPRLPHLPPDLAHVSEVLAGSEIPEDDAIFLLSLAGWVVLGYLVVILTIRSALLSVLCWCGASRAAWRLLRLLDPLTLPAVRRLTDGALAGALVTGAWVTPPAKARATTLHAVPSLPLSAAPASHPAIEWGVVGGAHVGFTDGLAAAPLAPPQRLAVPYTVVAGDTLWRIAEQCYGDGGRYQEIAAANAGRTMATGESFSDPERLQPGWVLLLPLPAANIEDDGAELVYRVQAGDSLWRVAAHLLGDGLRWPEIWERNQGRDLGDGQAFTNPSILEPGWRLRVPAAELALVPAAPVGPSVLPPPATTLTPDEPPASSESQPAGDRTGGWTPAPIVGAGALAGLAAAGAAVAVARRRRHDASVAVHGPRRRPSRPDRRGRRPPGDLQGDVERVRLAGRLALAGLDELGFGEVRLLTCREEPEAVVLRLACPPGDAEAVEGVQFALARRVGCLIDAHALPGEQVELTMSRLRRESAALFGATEVEDRALLITPVGAQGGAVTYLNLAGVSNVALLGTATQTHQLLRTWLATLAASVPPGAYVVAPASSLRDAPEWRECLGDHPWPPEADGVAPDLAATLEAELVARLAAEPARAEVPAILAILTADLAPDVGRVETLLRRGRPAGLHTIVLAEEHAASAADRLITACAARVTFTGSGDDHAAPPGTLALAIGNGPSVTLTPVQIPDDPMSGQTIGPSGRHSAGQSSHATPQPELLHSLRVPSEGPVAEGERDDSTSVGADRAVTGRDAVPRGSHPAGDGGADRVAPAAIVQQLTPGRAANGHIQRPVSAPLMASRSIRDREDSEPEGEAAPRFAVRCFGGFVVEWNGAPVMNWKMQKARELLAFLVTRGGAPVPREEAWEALWPGQELELMQRNLSEAAYHLRRALREVSAVTGDLLTTQGQRYHLDPRRFRIDLTSFEAHLRHAATLPSAEALVAYERALAKASGEVFGSEPFEWAEPLRRAHRTRFVKAAHAAARLATERCDLAQAADFLRLVLERDPVDEEAARGLMRTFAQQDDVNGVRKTYKALVAALRRELDDPTAEPMPETTELLHSLVPR